MIDLKDIPERKLLSEQCWIDVFDDVKIRIDYPSRSQWVELRRLAVLWDMGKADGKTNHWIEYYIRCSLREVAGFTIEEKPARLILENGLARYLGNGEKNLDVLSVFSELGILLSVAGLIRERLEFNELDKKKFQSQPSLLNQETSS